MVEVEKKISSVEPSKLGIKKTYTPPSLLEYGNIAKLTQGGAAQEVMAVNRFHDDDVPVGPVRWGSTSVVDFNLPRDWKADL